VVVITVVPFVAKVICDNNGLLATYSQVALLVPSVTLCSRATGLS
jgi:hypothetical protein